MNTRTPPLQTFLITGASGGIGGAVARRLAARDGARVVLHGRSEVKLSALAASCAEAGTAPALVRAGDLTSPREVEELLAAATEALGGKPPEAVVHAAGIGLIKPTDQTTDGEFTRVMNVNTRATFLLARECARVWTGAKARGLFVTLPGILGKAAMKNAAAYAASKYAVTGMLKCMAQEYARAGVRFSLLHLGGVDTPFWDGIGMAVQRDKMIPAETAADCVLAALDTPAHLVLGDLTLQPESHQM